MENLYEAIKLSNKIVASQVKGKVNIKRFKNIYGVSMLFQDNTTCDILNLVDEKIIVHGFEEYKEKLSKIASIGPKDITRLWRFKLYDSKNTK